MILSNSRVIRSCPNILTEQGFRIKIKFRNKDIEVIDDDFLIDLVPNNKWTDLCIQIVMRIIHKLHGRLRPVFIVTANPYGLIRFTVTYTISKKALLILHFNGQDLIDMKLYELKMCVTKLILSIQDVALRRKGLTNVCYKNE